MAPDPDLPPHPPPTVLILGVTASPNGTLDGTARRPHDEAELPFHGVVDLVGVIERLVSSPHPPGAGEPPEPG